MSKPTEYERTLDELRSELSYALYIGFPTRLRIGIHMPHAVAKNRGALRQTIARIRALDAVRVAAESGDDYLATAWWETKGLS